MLGNFSLEITSRRKQFNGHGSFQRWSMFGLPAERLWISVYEDDMRHLQYGMMRVLVECMDDMDADSLKSAANFLVDTLRDPAAVVLGSSPGEGKVSLIAAFTPGVVDMGMQAGKFIGPIAKLCGGGEGGGPNFSQAGGTRIC
ncbi:alanine--tRNA ligase, chloroplastic/mitochondrial [Actinidia eriantha]|uniref:alanine--tRNA ligase, chloroplastic/mitochondrial n=1 Tax=Actinidia eriantha TaxID=165200 RepID=UPI002590C50D|nr:alanine--tRNA ligase, chloroplastic/mitochondrial [Actinidia eriantha]